MKDYQKVSESPFTIKEPLMQYFCFKNRIEHKKIAFIKKKSSSDKGRLI